jgi:hypothetical protein
MGEGGGEKRALFPLTSIPACGRQALPPGERRKLMEIEWVA